MSFVILKQTVIPTALLSALFGCVATNAFAHGNAHNDVPSIQLSNEIGQNPPVFAEIVRPAPTPQINPAVGGKWSNVYDWPLVAVHAALLPTGKVLAWDATPDDSDDDPHTTDNKTTRVTLWDPASDTHVQTNNDTDTDLFCAGSAHLWDGRILFAGGDGGKAGANGPLVNSNIYNPVTNTWHRTEEMNAPRWYSSVAALSNGEMLTLGGTYDPKPLGEVFQFDQTWRPLLGTVPQLINEDYQWIQQTPEGSVLLFGPSNLLVDIDTAGTGSFTPLTTRDSIEDRDYGSYAMYTTGKILVAGGAQGSNTSVVIDTATRQTTDTNPLTYGRRQHNLTILADGSVLATGGNSDGARYFSPTASVMQPEIWNPETELWTVQNTIPTDRQYHSIALLLPDGQVLSAGGGICGDCYRLNYEERNAEIFAPPYLFNEDGTRATRPRLGSVPSNINYAEQILVSVDDSIDIGKVHLIKLGSVTHSENQDQRLVPLQFDRASRRLTVQMPDSRDVAPPGHYLLFVVDNNGVPSTGTMLKLGQPLLAAGQQTRTTLELNTWDTYVTAPIFGKAAINLNAVNGTLLYVSASNPVRSAQQSDVMCSAVADASGNAVCEVSGIAGKQLHISVNGSERADYSLVYTESEDLSAPEPEITTPEPTDQTSNNGGTPNSAVNTGSEQPSTNSATQPSAVRTGVGSITLFWVLMLMFSGLLRRISCRISVFN